MFRLTVAVAIFVVSPALVQSKDPPTKPKPTQKLDLDRVVADLSSPIYRVRVAASERLAKLGKSAKPQLQTLARHQDAEVRARAGELLARLEPTPKVPNQWQGEWIAGGALIIDSPIEFDVDGVVVFEDVEIIELVEEEVVEAIEVEVAPAAMRFVPPAGESATDAAVSSAIEWIRKHSTGEKAK
ncbi:MAG: hypothetical protein MI757_11450 [Pirellulales bacterium]|nr:hypothetical protein [Pirellulales bacterium]